MTSASPPHDRVRVCFISFDVYSLFDPQVKVTQGGSAVDVYMIASALARDHDFQVAAITANFGQRDVETVDNVTIYKTADSRTNGIFATFRLWQTMRNVAADVYFTKGASNETALATLFGRLHHKAVFIRTSSDFECDGSFTRRYWFRGRIFLWALRKARTILVQTRHNQASLASFADLSSQVISNGHYLGKEVKRDRDIILWVGRSVGLKNPQLFIDLAEQIPTEQFLMICQKTRNDESYDSLIEKAGAVKNLNLIGFVPFHEIDRYFQRAKMVVSTSSSEGFPNVFIQAGKNGAPILSLHVNPDGFLDQYKCGFCAAGDWDRFVDHARELLDVQRQSEFGHNAYQYCKANHDIEAIVGQYKSLFSQAASQLSSSPLG